MNDNIYENVSKLGYFKTDFLNISKIPTSDQKNQTISIDSEFDVRPADSTFEHIYESVQEVGLSDSDSIKSDIIIQQEVVKEIEVPIKAKDKKQGAGLFKSVEKFFLNNNKLSFPSRKLSRDNYLSEDMSANDTVEGNTKVTEDVCKVIQEGLNLAETVKQTIGPNYDQMSEDEKIEALKQVQEKVTPSVSWADATEYHKEDQNLDISIEDQSTHHKEQSNQPDTSYNLDSIKILPISLDQDVSDLKDDKPSIRGRIANFITRENKKLDQGISPEEPSDDQFDLQDSFGIFSISDKKKNEDISKELQTSDQNAIIGEIPDSEDYNESQFDNSLKLDTTKSNKKKPITGTKSRTYTNRSFEQSGKLNKKSTKKVYIPSDPIISEKEIGNKILEHFSQIPIETYQRGSSGKSVKYGEDHLINKQEIINLIKIEVERQLNPLKMMINSLKDEIEILKSSSVSPHTKTGKMIINLSSSSGELSKPNRGITKIGQKKREAIIEQNNIKSKRSDEEEAQAFLKRLAKSKIIKQNVITSQPYSEETATIIDDEGNFSNVEGAVALPKIIKTLEKLNQDPNFNQIMIHLLDRAMDMNLNKISEFNNHIKRLIKEANKNFRKEFNIEIEFIDDDSYLILSKHLFNHRRTMTKTAKKEVLHSL